MSELKPCPFCGNNDHLKFSFSFKKDRKVRLGIHFDLCELKCHGCSARMVQAGPGREKAQENAISMWNRRANDEAD